MISPNWIIQKKRDGKELTPEEIQDFVKGVTHEGVADYQASAFLMAVYFQGMSLKETVALTEAMLGSGEKYDFPGIRGPMVDKHSTGGVGDKVSLILAPLAAACGLKVPMMSGRGLGHTGGTLDKLEAIPGFKTQLNRQRFAEVLQSVGCAMIGQSENIAPADKKLYALRDVTGTVECIPLIVASILSKKLAEGAHALVLDIKVGSGAFMKTRAEARKLAKALVQVAGKLGMPTRALVTNMSQPLGYAVGHALEVKECIEILRNERGDFPSADLIELTIQLCAQMLVLGGVAKNLAEGRKLSHARLNDGSAWKVFENLVKAQGGDLAAISKAPFLAFPAKQQVSFNARKAGYISSMDTEALGKMLIEMGGGRRKVTDRVNLAPGMVFVRKLGAKVRVGDPIMILHHDGGINLATLEETFHKSIGISTTRKAVPQLIFEQL